MSYRVVVDYGHGGVKSGAEFGGIQEKTLNLLTGKEIYTELHAQKEGNEIQVMLTRDADYDISLTTRYKLINEHHKNIPIDLVISVHYNAISSSKIGGFEAYYYESSQNGGSASARIVDSIRSVGIPIGTRGSGLITTKQLGRKLAMIHKVVPPSVLIEVGYMTNPVDLINAQSHEFRKNVAKAVSSGIWNYLTQPGAGGLI